ncbi:MAG: zf-TFIIB domain-containing protein [Elusimicrobiota bacterium]
MKCPKCASSELAPKQDNFLLETDRCADCGGVWFDQQEIYAKIKNPTKFFAAFKEAYSKAAETDFKCPRDGERMIQTTFERASLPFEACAKCGGMWFDKGEVEKLNRFLDEWQNAPDNAQS